MSGIIGSSLGHDIHGANKNVFGYNANNNMERGTTIIMFGP